MDVEAHELVQYGARLAAQSAELAASSAELEGMHAEAERHSGELAVELMRAQANGIQMDEQRRALEAAKKVGQSWGGASVTKGGWRREHRGT